MVFEKEGGVLREHLRANRKQIAELITRVQCQNPKPSLLLAILQDIFIFLAIIRGVRVRNLISDIQY